MINGCLLVVQLRAGELRDVAERRVSALERFYAPLGGRRASIRFVDGLRLLIGWLPFDGTIRDIERPLAWGGPLRDPLSETSGLIEATDAQLRELEGPLAAVAASADRGVVVTAAGGVQSLYESSGSEARAWSSHAVAAGWFAHGRVEVDPGAIAEQLTAEFVSGDRTLVRGVTAVAPATRISLTPAGAAPRSFWPAGERWQPIAREQAAERAEREFLAGLERELTGASDIVVGLTAGLDSRTVAVALRELGVPFEAFTFTTHVEDESAASAAIAARLGIRHTSAAVPLWGDADGVRLWREQVRWHEGGVPVGFGDVPWPAAAGWWVSGAGAETGRAFYYRWMLPREGDGTQARVFHAFAGPRLRIAAGAPRSVRTTLRGRWHEEIDEAVALGYGGWSALNVFYAEQRVRRWGRAMLPRLAARPVLAFGGPRLLPALAALPLEDQLQDGFQRRFLARHAPEQLPDPVTLPAGRRPSVLRYRALAVAGDLRRSLHLPSPRREEAVPWQEHPPWDERPTLIAWLGDVLESPLVVEAMGARWAREQHSAFRRGVPAAAEAATWMGGPVALSEALSDLTAHA